MHLYPEWSFLLFFEYLFISLAALGLSCSMWDLVACLGIETGSSALRVRSLGHWITREISRLGFLKLYGNRGNPGSLGSWLWISQCPSPMDWFGLPFTPPQHWACFQQRLLWCVALPQPSSPQKKQPQSPLPVWCLTLYLKVFLFLGKKKTNKPETKSKCSNLFRHWQTWMCLYELIC